MKHIPIHFRIALRIVLLCCTGMAMTYVNDLLAQSAFFGDKPEDQRYIGCFLCDGLRWGPRHIWFFWMCVCLFLLGLVRAVSLSFDDVDND